MYHILYACDDVRSGRKSAWPAAWLLLGALALFMAGPSKAAPPPGMTLGPGVVWIDSLPAGPFIRLADGRLLTVDATHTLVSHDEGAHWEQAQLFDPADRYELRPERALIQSRRGTLVLAFVNNKERQWRWDKNHGEPGPEVTLPTYVTRSQDQGQTWQKPIKLHDDWTGAIRDILETDDGAIVFTTMKILRNPGRHGCLTYRSDDDGLTWQASNLLDLGGHGHHDGALEPTIVQLKDGRLWMLIRTTHDVFFESFSKDDGRSWSEPQPTTIDASTAPGMLTRLASGRLSLVWNRFARQGQGDPVLRGGDNQWSARPASNQRQELSIAVSDDDGQTWSAPLVVARADNVDTSYPYVFEPRPGTLWITTMRGSLSLEINERDLMSQAPTATTSQSLRIACVGDSLTKGTGAPKHSYPLQLDALLPEAWDVQNFGHNGVTALSTTGRPLRSVDEFPAVARFDPDVVVLGLGTNDAAAHNLSLTQFAEDYTRLIDHFRSLPSRPRVFVLTPPPLMPGRDDARMTCLAEQVVPLIRTLGPEHEATVIDLHRVESLQDPQLYPDQVHLNAEGYGLMAEQIAHALLASIAADEARPTPDE